MVGEGFVILAALLLGAAAPPPGYVLDPPRRRAIAARHVLIISDGNGMTRMNYATEGACQRAREVVRRQTDARLTNTNPGIVYASPRVQAFCVPL